MRVVGIIASGLAAVLVVFGIQALTTKQVAKTDLQPTPIPPDTRSLPPINHNSGDAVHSGEHVVSRADNVRKEPRLNRGSGSAAHSSEVIVSKTDDATEESPIAVGSGNIAPGGESDDSDAGNPPKEPPELAKARLAYEAELKAAIDPITAAYLRQLDKMMKHFGSQGDAESAKVAQDAINELSRAKPLAAPRAASVPSIVGKWTWLNGIPRILPNARAKNSSGEIGNWRVTDEARGQYEVAWPSGYTDWIQMSVDGSEIVVANKDQRRHRRLLRNAR